MKRKKISSMGSERQVRLIPSGTTRPAVRSRTCSYSLMASVRFSVMRFALQSAQRPSPGAAVAAEEFGDPLIPQRLVALDRLVHRVGISAVAWFQEGDDPEIEQLHVRVAARVDPDEHPPVLLKRFQRPVKRG